MAIGIFRKIGDFFKKVFKKVVPIVRKVAQVAAPVLQAIPHPAAQGIGMGLQFANQTLGNLANTTGLVNSSDVGGLPSIPVIKSAPENVSDLIKFSKI